MFNLAEWWKRSWKPLEPVVEMVEVTPVGVRRRRGELLEEVQWKELVGVEIVTTDEGPFVDDVFWLLSASNGTGCLVRNAKVEPLLPHLQRLPRFNHVAVIEAMGSTEQARFVAWRGEPGEGLAAAPPIQDTIPTCPPSSTSGPPTR